MREFKFRAWNKIKKYFEYNVQECYDGLGDYYHSECSFGSYISSKKWDVNQFTGLKDKNGKEIYFDSDVIKATITDDYTGKESSIIGVLYLNLKRFKICMKGHEDFNLSFAEDIEIIGNIYENPELL